MRDRVRLDSIMCVVDAEQVFAAPEMMELKLRQVAFADMLILNKVDLVDPEEIQRIKAWLDDRFHRYRLVQTSRGNVPLEILLSVGRFDPAQLDETAPHVQLGHSSNCGDRRLRTSRARPSQRSLAGLQDVELRVGRTSFAGSTAANRAQASGQRLPMQGRRSNRRRARPTRHPPGCWQACGYRNWGCMERQRTTNPDSGDWSRGSTDETSLREAFDKCRDAAREPSAAL